MCNRPSKQDVEWASTLSYVAAPLGVDDEQQQHQTQTTAAAVTVSEDSGSASQDSMTGIVYPGVHDVMLGRGGESNKHIGNIKFRKFIEKYKKIYQNATRSEKAEIALEVVYTWREMDPPGRFLTKTYPKNGDKCLWHDVGDEQARKKTSKSLGERKNFDSNLSVPNPTPADDSNMLLSSNNGQKKRSRDHHHHHETSSSSSKRQRSVGSCSSSGSSIIAESCPTWMPDDWSDSASASQDSGATSSHQQNEDIVSDDISIASDNDDNDIPRFLDTDSSDWWKEFEMENMYSVGTEHISEQSLFKDTVLVGGGNTTTTSSQCKSHSTTGPITMNHIHANNALKNVMVHIPTAADLINCDIFS